MNSPVKEKKKKSYIIKKKRKVTIYCTWWDNFECELNAVNISWKRLHWPSASLSFQDCAADVKNSLFKAELVTFRRPSMQAWGEKAQCYDSYHHNHCIRTSTSASYIWCTLNHVESGITKCCTDVIAEWNAYLHVYYIFFKFSKYYQTILWYSLILNTWYKDLHERWETAMQW